MREELRTEVNQEEHENKGKSTATRFRQTLHNTHTQVKLGPGAGISYGTRDGGTEARECLGGPARVKILSRARTPAFGLSPPYVLRF